jgi:hypothetical protein
MPRGTCKKARIADPAHPQPTEERYRALQNLTMESPKTRTIPPLEEATADQLKDALLHWEDLEDSALIKLASHPRSARRLAGLRVVERELNEAAREADRAEAERFDASTCPPAEELFDFGRGPGFQYLGEVREEILARHLESCANCAGLIATLRTPPPLPLEASSEQAPNLHSVPARPLDTSARWRLFLVAASVAGMIMVPFMMGDRGLGLDHLPEHTITRGPSTTAHFPQLKLLAVPDAETGELLASPYFEFEGVATAGEYRVEVRMNDGGPFEQGVRVQDLREASPSLAGAALPLGSYSWRAWAEVNGLEQDVVSADLVVIEDPQLADLLTSLDAEASVSELVEAIRELHASGFIADARALARRLPQSPQRENYLRLSAD